MDNNIIFQREQYVIVYEIPIWTSIFFLLLTVELTDPLYHKPLNCDRPEFMKITKFDLITNAQRGRIFHIKWQK